MELWSSSQASWTLLYGLQLSQLLMLLRKDGEGRQEQAQALCRGLGAGRTREGTSNPLPGSTELAGGMFSCFPLTPESVGCKKGCFSPKLSGRRLGKASGEQLAREQGRGTE